MSYTNARDGWKNKQQGSVVVIVLVAIIVLLVAGGGWYVWRQHKNSAVSTTTTSTTTRKVKDDGAADPSLEQIAQQAAGMSACASMQLSQGTSDGTAGTIYTHAVVTNIGSTTCTLTGYPTVKLLDGGGAVLGVEAAHNSLYPATTVSVAPGGKAHVVLAFTDAGAYDPGTCTAMSTTMQMYLPSVVTPITTAWAAQNCPSFTTSVFQPGE